MAKKLCPEEDPWQAVYEGDSYQMSCPAGYTGSISRLCSLGGVWAAPVNNCSRCGLAA